MRSTLVVMLLVASAFAQDLSSRPASACGSKDVSFDAAPFTAHSTRLFAWSQGYLRKLPPLVRVC
jgi:hypothetical protein